VLKTPQPRQLKYKTGLIVENGGSPSIQENGGSPSMQARAEEEDESDIALGAIEAVGIAVALVIVGVLVIILGVRHNRRRQAQKSTGDNGQKATSSPEPPCATAPSELQQTPIETEVEEAPDAAGTDSFTLDVSDLKPVVETTSKASLETSDSIEHACNSQEVLLGISKASLETFESLEDGCNSRMVSLEDDNAETSTTSGLDSEAVTLDENKMQEGTFAL
jgi:hypothetical protein